MIVKHSSDETPKPMPVGLRLARVISIGNGTVDVCPIGSSVVLHDIPVTSATTMQVGDVINLQMMDNKRFAFAQQNVTSASESSEKTVTIINAAAESGGGGSGSTGTLTVGSGLSVNPASSGNLGGAVSLALNDSVARSTWNVVAGSGLTGGGSLSPFGITLNVGAGDGIAVAADSVSVKLAATSGLSFATDALQIADSIAGDGLQIASKVLAVDSTVVRTSREIATGNGLTGGGDLTASRTLAVGAGNGISVLTDTVAVNQAYAFTWSAAHTFSARPTFSAGATISAGQTLRFGADVDLQRKDANILSLASGDNMESTTFQSGVSGWQITSAGDAEFNNVRVRGELSASVFTLNEIAASAGTLGVFKSAGVVWSDFTTPSAVGNSGTLLAKNSDAAAPLFAVGDRLEIKAWTGTAIVDIWLEVTARTNNTTHTSYSVTLRSGSTGVVIPAGVAIADWGPSGSGAVTLSADGTIGASANLSVQSHTGSPWSARTLHLRLGNLNGSYGYNTAVYGFAAGDSATTFVAVDATNGFRVVRDSTTRFQVDTAGALTIRNTAGVAVITMDSTSARIDNVLNIGASGEIRQGTGSLTASPATYTGLRIWAETSGGNLFGRIGGYNGGTLQWYAGTDGKLYAGEGGVSLSASGVLVDTGGIQPNPVQKQLYGFVPYNAATGIAMAGAYAGLSYYRYNKLRTEGELILTHDTSAASSNTYIEILSFAAASYLSEITLEARSGTTSKHLLISAADGVRIPYGLNVGSATGATTGQVRAHELYLGTGSDVQLYRSAANMLRTPDSATIDGGLNVGSVTGAGAGNLNVQLRMALNGATLNTQATMNVCGQVNAFPAASGLAGEAAIRVRGGNSTGTAESGTVLDISASGSAGQQGGWMQVRNTGDYSLNYQMLINPNGGNVGINTAYPGYPLDVEGSIQTSGSIRIWQEIQVVRNATGYTGYIYVPNTAYTNLWDETPTQWAGSTTKAVGSYRINLARTTSGSANSLPSGVKAVVLAVRGQWTTASASNRINIRDYSGASPLTGGTNQLIITAGAANIPVDNVGIVNVGTSNSIVVEVAGASVSSGLIRVIGYYI